MELQPISRASASDAVYEQLAAGIVAGELAAGSTIPSERALAASLDVSRPVVREGLKRLAQAGLVAIRHGGATTVADYHRTAGPELLGVLLAGGGDTLDLGVARSIVEARSDLGPAVVARAATRAAPADLVRLHELVASMRETEDLLALQRRALDFWDATVDASGNVVHRLLFNALRRAYEPVMDALAPLMQEEFRDLDGYAAVVAALEARDPAAAEQAARRLVDRGAGGMLDAIDRMLEGDHDVAGPREEPA